MATLAIAKIDRSITLRRGVRVTGVAAAAYENVVQFVVSLTSGTADRVRSRGTVLRMAGDSREARHFV